MVQARAVQAVVGAEVDGHDAAVVRNGRAHRRQVPPRLRRRHGLLRPLHRGDAALAHRLDERGRRRERLRDHRDLRGERRPDAARHERALSVQGSARRGRHRRGGRHARDVRATGRAARHAPLSLPGLRAGAPAAYGGYRMDVAKLSIDIWSDIACPWCYIGKRHLEQALERFAHRADVEVVWRAFELDPSAPRVRDSSQSYAERLAKKYGMRTQDAQLRIDRMVELAAGD